MNTNYTLPRGRALRLIMLDCDGVLFDSFDANVAFYDSILKTLGHPPLDEVGRELCHRMAGPQLWAHLFAGDETAHARAKAAAAQANYDPFYALMQPVPELASTLDRLGRHCRLAMATNRGRTVEGVVRHFGLDRFLSSWLGVLDVPHPKPAPDLLLASLDRTSVPAAAAVYVGDTATDYEAAAASSVPYVGVGRRSNAAYTIADLRELPDLLGIP
ncbi:MAG: HAD family hydrolase [Dehalococcoidia bacterium]|nr:HAD family hydrolase [Dehalococcoidia bacterium]